jgi:hypothetical protein
MASVKPARVSPLVGSRTPITVWILTFLFGLMAFVSLAGPFLFAFPMGTAAGYVIGTLLLIASVGYASIIWRLRRGERTVWLAALALPIVHTIGLNGYDLVAFGAIPSENYPFIVVALVVVALLLAPVTRQFFTK